MIFADIIIDISVKSLDKTFQYIVPASLEDEVKTGSLVTVPFGNGNRQLKGYVVNLTDTPKFDRAKTKSITGVEKMPYQQSHTCLHWQAGLRKIMEHQ